MQKAASINTRLLKIAFQWGRGPVMSSKLLTRAIFGVDPTLRRNKARDKFFWDITTLNLKKALLIHVRDGQRVLEIGSGEYGILTVFLAKKRKIDLTAVEIVPSFVDTCREIAENNRVNVRIIESNMFENVQGSFDVIFWNLPYVPTDFGAGFYKSKGGSPTFGPEGWHGGPTGFEPFDLFLKEAPKALNDNGKLIAGLNTYFTPKSRILEMIQGRGLFLNSVCGSAFNPSKAFVITKRP
ncbi:MAG: methyltransferase [Candidatus Omnitrophica bacterium]|nr:methyltransferase [Candidatus Omnitrophota bacterium]